MKREPIFKGLPESFWVVVFVYAYLFFYLTYIHFRGSVLNRFEFYSISLLPILAVVSVRGMKLWDELGFDLNHAPTYIKFVRFLIVIFAGFLIGYSLFKLDSLSFSVTGFHLMPLDVHVLGLDVNTTAFLGLMDCFVIAFFEEIIRAVGFMGFSNAFYERGLSKGDSIILGTVWAGLLFILLHYYSWGGFNIISIIVGTSMVSLMTISGWLLYERKIFGPLAFQEWSIYTPMVAHMIYDFLVFQHLSVGLGIIPSLVFS